MNHFAVILFLALTLFMPVAVLSEEVDGAREHMPTTPNDVMYPHQNRFRPQTEQEAKQYVNSLLDEVMASQNEALTLMREGKRTDSPSAAGNGSAGVLWVFWSVDAPQAEHLGRMVGEVRIGLPDIQIQLVHVMPISAWYGWLHDMNGLKDRIMQAASQNRMNEAQELGEEMVSVSKHLGALPRLVGKESVRLYEDVSAAIEMDVKDLPSFVYISPRGETHHRLKGAGAGTNLPLWIGRCLQWEAQQAEKGNP